MKKGFWFGLMMVVVWAAGAQVPVGQWQDHASFVAAHKVQVSPDKVYAATRMSMFYHDKEDFSTKALTKTTGLTDVGVSTFAYDERSRFLIVAYSNSAIDLKLGSQVYHIADIRHSNISGDKKIYHVRFHGGKAYLATGFGIVVVDLSRHEISETYYLGNQGGQGTVYDIAFTDSLIVAATDNGLLYAPKSSNRLHIYEEWTLDTLSPLQSRSVRELLTSQGRIMASTCRDNPDTSTIYYQTVDGDWDSLRRDHVESIKAHNGFVLVNKNYCVEIYDADFQLETVLNALSSWDVDIDADGTLWVGHAWAGLVKIPKPYSSSVSFAPQGPFNDDYVYSITSSWDNVYVCKGGKKPTYESAYLSPSVTYFDGKQWEQLGFSGLPVQDILNVAVDPTDYHHVVATSWGSGVVDFYRNEARELYSYQNVSEMVPYRSGNYVHQRVSGLAFDWNGDLWITNSLVDKGLLVRRKNGDWQSFDISPMLNGVAGEKREIDKIIWDSIYGYKWFAGRANRIYVHDGNNRMAYVNPNNGSKLETHTVTCLVQDHSGDIWFGTDKGIKVIYDGYRVFSNGGRGEQASVNCSNILYSEDGIYEYLMAYESITCIAVDGANRKWVGTSNNGLYLISANGLEQLEHFTTANSPLNSDKIVALAVHPVTGQVYIGTNMGVQSYRATATYADAEPESDIHAFPNPVRPDYDGLIAIKGFTRDALVHITDSRGHVVYTTKANGGQAIWNGCTIEGGRVASGTYFVFASDQAGSMRSVAKILMIR